MYEDAESMSLLIKGVTAEDAGAYTVTATNELGEDSAEMHLTVKSQLLINIISFELVRKNISFNNIFIIIILVRIRIIL